MCLLLTFSDLYICGIPYKRDQKEGETIESFHATVRSLAKTCNYSDACINSILRYRIVIGIRDATITVMRASIHSSVIVLSVE